MIYKKLQLEDYEQFSALRQRGLHNYPEAFTASNFEETLYRRAKYETLMQHAESFIVGAFDGQHLCGIAGFDKEIKYKLKHRGSIWGVYLDPEYQHQGIALQLLNAALELAFQNPQLEQVYIECSASNNAAVHLYINVGFEQYGYQKNAVFVNGKYIDQILMVKFRTKNEG